MSNFLSVCFPRFVGSTPYWGNEQGSGGRRKYYQITDKGKNEFEQKVSEWEFIKKNIDIFLTQE